MQKIGKIHMLSILFITTTYFMACTPKKSYKVLSFFFDGVPIPDTTEYLASVDSILAADSTNITATNNLVPAMFYHAPYQKKQCESCHDQRSMGKTIKPQPQLCYNCHDDFSEIYKSIHGPVGGGFCTSCHNPHKSKTDKLLLRTTQKLCTFCHDSLLVFNSRYHQDNDISNCTECHNPHGGDNRFMPQKGSCYKCHENFNNKLKYVHGPVAGEYCTTCHSPHVTKTFKLLKKQGNALCLNCHDKKLIFETNYHKNTDKTCTKCHNPHGGDNRFFIKPK